VVKYDSLWFINDAGRAWNLGKTADTSGIKARLAAIENDTVNFKSAYSHSLIINGNPHGLTAADIGLDDYTRLLGSSAYTNVDAFLQKESDPVYANDARGRFHIDHSDQA
jgi:hypothetical protein